MNTTTNTNAAIASTIASDIEALVAQAAVAPETANTAAASISAALTSLAANCFTAEIEGTPSEGGFAAKSADMFNSAFTAVKTIASSDKAIGAAIAVAAIAALGGSAYGVMHYRGVKQRAVVARHNRLAALQDKANAFGIVNMIAANEAVTSALKKFADDLAAMGGIVNAAKITDAQVDSLDKTLSV